MDATPFSFGQPPATPILPASGRPLFGQATASMISMKWSALHDAAAAVAAIAGLAAEPMRADVRNFPAVMRDAGGWRRDLAEQGIEDLSAIMEPGLAALLAAHARGRCLCSRTRPLAGVPSGAQRLAGTDATTPGNRAVAQRLTSGKARRAEPIGNLQVPSCCCMIGSRLIQF